MKRYDWILYLLGIVCIIGINACDPIPSDDPAPSIVGLSEPQRIEQMSRHQIINELSREAAKPEVTYTTPDGMTFTDPWAATIHALATDEPQGTEAAQHSPLCSIWYGGICTCNAGTPIDSTRAGHGRGAGHYQDYQEQLGHYVGTPGWGGFWIPGMEW